LSFDAYYTSKAQLWFVFGGINKKGPKIMFIKPLGSKGHTESGEFLVVFEAIFNIWKKPHQRRATFCLGFRLMKDQ